MTKTEYTLFLQDPQKRIEGDIKLKPKPQHDSMLWSGRITIENSTNFKVYLEISYNPEVDSKIFCLWCPDANGPICRLCVDGTPHRPCGRSHKHKLGTNNCPKENLKNHVEDMPDLSGKGIVELFGIFCTLLNLKHDGSFNWPN